MPLEKRKLAAVWPPAPVVDEFTATFPAARPYISEFCFVYSFLFRPHAVPLNAHPQRRLGVRHTRPGRGSSKGVDVLRFFVALHTIASEAVFDALRGGAIANDVDVFVDGIYDLRFFNFIFLRDHLLRGVSTP